MPEKIGFSGGCLDNTQGVGAEIEHETLQD